MSMRSWQQTVGTIGVLVSLAILGQVVQSEISLGLGIAVFMFFISGAFVGYGIVVPHEKDCICLHCGTERIIQRDIKKRNKK